MRYSGPQSCPGISWQCMSLMSKCLQALSAAPCLVCLLVPEHCPCHSYIILRWEMLLTILSCCSRPCKLDKLHSVLRLCKLCC